MSKKKKKKVQPKPINKRLRAIICICVAAALLLGGLLTWYLLTKEKPLIVQYNGAMTSKAQREGYLSANEVIIVHTVDDSAGGFVQLHCYIYQVPEHVSTKRMLKFYAHELPKRWHLEPVGTATAKFLTDNLDTLYAMSVAHTK
jgi:hypothetical protein